MQEIAQIFSNQVLLVAVFASLTAQGLKVIIELIRHGQVNLRFLFTTGGMPSAHSALVSALATQVGMKMGWSSPDFAIAALFAVIVMYDAAGVRQAVGKQAEILNQIIAEFFEEGHHLNGERLKELIGHTRFQVVVGLILGIAIALIASMELSI
jgi:acid phosphatase family membrane protein YuiD